MAPRTVLITGCSAGGIGSALVESFEKSGLYVFATGRSISKMSHLEQLHNVDLLSLDVTSTSSISAAVEAVTAKTGGTLDYLVNNAGIGYFLPTLDVNIDEAKKMFDINVWGALAVIKMFAPLVIAAKGTIVNISSVAGQLYPVWESELEGIPTCRCAQNDENRCLRSIQSCHHNHRRVTTPGNDTVWGQSCNGRHWRD